MFDDYDFHNLLIPWQNGLGGLVSLNAGCEDFRTRQKLGKYTRRFDYIVHCVFGGKGRLIMDGRTYSLREGDMFCVLPQKDILYEPDEAEPWRYCWIGFQGERAGRYVRELGFNRVTPTRQMNDPAATERLFREYLDNARCLTKQQISMPSYAHAALAFFHAFLSLELREEASTWYFPEGTPELLRTYIENHFCDACFSFSDDFLPFHMTSHLRAKFRAKYGQTPSDYLTACRLQHAASVLASGDETMTVAEVASMCGYNDALYFMRVFKKTYDCTVIGYKKFYHPKYRDVHPKEKN